MKNAVLYLNPGHSPSAADRVHQDQPRVHDPERRLVPLESLPRKEPAARLREGLARAPGTHTVFLIQETYALYEYS